MKYLGSIATVFLSGLLWTSSSSATIYLVAVDPATQSVGMAAISSGPVVSYTPHAMNGVKGIGFTGWSGSALNISPAMDQQVFKMMQNSSPVKQIEAFVDSQIHDKYSRYIFISTRGPLGYVFPPPGCAQPECGVQVSSTLQFFVMGGGLQHDVVSKTVQIYEMIHQNRQLPFECKLLAGIQTIINVGGEIKEFAEAGIAVDSPAHREQEWFKSVDVPESKVVPYLRNQMSRSGVNCPEMYQVKNLKRKPKRDPRSRDL